MTSGISTIYTTVDRGRLHIAYDADYQGSINSYNNFFTKFFANLFHLSIDVTINDKVRRLNKKSYLKFLHKHDVSVASLKGLARFAHLEPSQRLTNLGRMTGLLSKQKVKHLTAKMISSLVQNKAPHVMKTLGRGADPNQLFWIRGCDKNPIPILEDNEANLGQGLQFKKIDKFLSENFTPFLYAISRGQDEIRTALVSLGSEQKTPGKRVSFEREIVGPEIDNGKTKFKDTCEIIDELFFNATENEVMVQPCSSIQQVETSWSSSKKVPCKGGVFFRPLKSGVVEPSSRYKIPY